MANKFSDFDLIPLQRKHFVQKEINFLSGHGHLNNEIDEQYQQMISLPTYFGRYPDQARLELPGLEARYIEKKNEFFVFKQLQITDTRQTKIYDLNGNIMHHMGEQTKVCSNIIYPQIAKIELNWSANTLDENTSVCLPNLSVLTLKGYQQLLLPDSIGNFSKLTELNIRNNHQQSLPESIGNLSNLSVLNLENNTSLQSLPESIGNLSRLTVLNLENNPSLQSLPESIGNLQSLTHLYLNGNDNLTSLPKSFAKLTNLKELVLPKNIKNLSPEIHQMLENMLINKRG